jgi:hypothetical protein
VRRAVKTGLSTGQGWSFRVVSSCIATQSSMARSWVWNRPVGRSARGVGEGHFGQSPAKQDQGHAGCLMGGEPFGWRWVLRVICAPWVEL